MVIRFARYSPCSIIYCFISGIIAEVVSFNLVCVFFSKLNYCQGNDVVLYQWVMVIQKPFVYRPIFRKAMCTQFALLTDDKKKID